MIRRALTAAVLALAVRPGVALAQPRPYLVVLGIGQDGGAPQAGSKDATRFLDPSRRVLATSLGLVDPARERRFLFEATPDLKEQLHLLDSMAPHRDVPGLAGIFLTHAHVGHYLGLAQLGHEAMGTRGVPVYTLPRFALFLRQNGPWSQLVRYQNVELRELTAGTPLDLGFGLKVTAFLVPHRQEYSEVAGFLIEGPRHRVLFIPDIDSLEQWDREGVRLEEELAAVDVAYLDGTFFADGEVPGRDMSGFPHPRIAATLGRLAPLPAAERAKVRFIHLNHTNPALEPKSAAAAAVRAAGCRVAAAGERVEL